MSNKKKEHQTVKPFYVFMTLFVLYTATVIYISKLPETNPKQPTSSSTTPIIETTTNKTIITVNTDAYKDFKLSIYTVEVEGCEYFIIPQFQEFSMCHKGNCKNQIHK